MESQSSNLGKEQKFNALMSVPSGGQERPSHPECSSRYVVPPATGFHSLEEPEIYWGRWLGLERLLLRKPCWACQVSRPQPLGQPLEEGFSA